MRMADAEIGPGSRVPSPESREIHADFIMARAQERQVHDIEYGRIAFFFGAQLLMQLGDRVIVIGRKRITKRLWALVVPRGDFGELVAGGDYRISWHDGHTHLFFELDGAVPEISLPRRGSFI